MKRFQNFREEFERIHEITDRASRGKMLEKFLGDFLKRNGGEVKFNPKGTKPRQSDLFVRFEENSVYHKIFHKRLKKPIKLEVVGEVVQARTFPQDSELAVNGVVAENPFFKKKKLPKEL